MTSFIVFTVLIGLATAAILYIHWWQIETADDEYWALLNKDENQ